MLNPGSWMPWFAILKAPQEEGKEPASLIGLSLKDIEKEVIITTLEQNGGNRTKAALILGVTRKTFQNKIKGYGIP